MGKFTVPEMAELFSVFRSHFVGRHLIEMLAGWCFGNFGVGVVVKRSRSEMGIKGAGSFWRGCFRGVLKLLYAFPNQMFCLYTQPEPKHEKPPI